MVAHAGVSEGGGHWQEKPGTDNVGAPTVSPRPVISVHRTISNIPVEGWLLPHFRAGEVQENLFPWEKPLTIS